MSAQGGEEVEKSMGILEMKGGTRRTDGFNVIGHCVAPNGKASKKDGSERQ